MIGPKAIAELVSEARERSKAQTKALEELQAETQVARVLILQVIAEIMRLRVPGATDDDLSEVVERVEQVTVAAVNRKRAQ